MPRLRQLQEQYTKNDFLREFSAQCARKGLTTNAAIGKAVGVCGASVGNYRREPGKIQLGTLQKIVQTLKPDIAVLLLYLGYSEKEIRRFARQYLDA